MEEAFIYRSTILLHHARNAHAETQFPFTLTFLVRVHHPLIVALLAVYALLTNPLLLIAIGFLSGGFIAINKFGELGLMHSTCIRGLCCRASSAVHVLTSAFLVFFVAQTAPEPSVTGEPSGPVTQKSLYTGLFVIGIPLLWLAAPLSTIFWIVGASSVLILGHASMLEPGVVSELE